jgi:hypothetical protein
MFRIQQGIHKMHEENSENHPVKVNLFCVFSPSGHPFRLSVLWEEMVYLAYVH